MAFWHKVAQLKKAGKLTPYLYERLDKRLVSAPEQLHEDLIKEAVMMSGIGVGSEEDHKIFFYIMRHSNSISKELSARSLNHRELSIFSNIMFENRKKFPINTIF